MEQGKPFFDVWLYEVSDEIQSLAQAFAERYMLEGALKNYNECKHAKTKELLEKTIMLHMIYQVRENKGWYMMNGVISAKAAAALDLEHDQAVKAYVPYMNTSVEGLGIFDHLNLIGPIARDYVAYNTQDDAENTASAGELFNFTTTGAPRAKL